MYRRETDAIRRTKTPPEAGFWFFIFFRLLFWFFFSSLALLLPRQDFFESRDEDGDHGGERAGAVQTAAGQGIESGLDRGDIRGAGDVVDGADAVIYGAGIGVLASPGKS
mgnify:CR=1 FL=1